MYLANISSISFCGNKKSPITSQISFEKNKKTNSVSEIKAAIIREAQNMAQLGLTAAASPAP